MMLFEISINSHAVVRNNKGHVTFYPVFPNDDNLHTITSVTTGLSTDTIHQSCSDFPIFTCILIVFHPHNLRGPDKICYLNFWIIFLNRRA